MWVKTEAGRAEMQQRALVHDRAQRNLLLLIDGRKSEATLLASVAGVTADDLVRLQTLGLIEPAAVPMAASAPGPLPESAPPALPPGSYAELSQALTKLVAKDLGLRGLPLTLAVEKASTLDELQAVAQRVLEQIEARHGGEAARLARRTLFGD